MHVVVVSRLCLAEVTFSADSGEEAIFTVLKMGKTLEECYEVLGLDSSASEGKFKVRQVLCAFVKTKCGVLD